MANIGAFPAQEELRRQQQPVFGGTWNPSFLDKLKLLFDLAGEAPSPAGGMVQGPQGFKSLGNAVERMLVQQAQNAGPELGPAGPVVARNTLMTAKEPVVESAMRRYRPKETAARRQASQVSAQDLAQDFQANELPNVIERYDPSSEKSLDAAIRSRARRGLNTARELEATVPKPGEGDIYRMSGKIAQIEEEFAKKFDGRKPSEFWIARKLGITPEAARDAMKAKEQNQLFGSVRFDELSRPGGRPFSELIPTTGYGAPQGEAIEQGASASANRANFTLFMDQLNATDKAILQKMSESKSIKTIAEELKAEGNPVSAAMVQRRQTSLINAVKDLREGRGFLGKLSPGGAETLPPLKIANPKEGGHEVVVQLYTGGTTTHKFGSEAKAMKFAREYLGGDARSVTVNGKEIKAIRGGSDAPALNAQNEMNQLAHLGVKFKSTEPGLAPGEKYHWYDVTVPNGDTTTGLITEADLQAGKLLDQVKETYKNYGVALPMSGGMGSPLGDAFQQLDRYMGQAGGYARPMRGERRVKHPSLDPSKGSAMDLWSKPEQYMESPVMSDRAVPGGEPGLDVRENPAAMRDFLQQLRPNLPPPPGYRWRREP